MIAELHSGRLDARIWGSKASNLASMATAGVPVPSGLCLWPTVSAAARSVAARAWLQGCAAPSLIVRSSTADEDGVDASGAGRSLSLPAVAPDAASVGDAFDALRAAADASALTLRSVIVQQEVVPSRSGVAFYERGPDELVIEADTVRFAVTGGERVSTRASVDHNGLVTVHRGVLPANEALAIQREARRIAELLSCDVDVEWGTVGGVLVVFQARPITAPLDA